LNKFARFSAAAVFAAWPAAHADAQEVAFRAPFTATGTFRSMPLGDGRRAQLNEGILVFAERADHGFKSNVVGQCMGIALFEKSGKKYGGHCTYVDASGDRIFESFEETKAGPDGVEGRGTGLGGTGKYANVTFNYTYRIRRAGPAADGTFRVEGEQVGTHSAGR
jgi:hypothetical protein